MRNVRRKLQFLLLVIPLPILGFAEKPSPGLTLSPISIDDVHDKDDMVKGYSPVPNVALSVKINGIPGVSSANANATGKFAIALPQAAHEGNFVEVSGKVPSGAELHGSSTVLASAPGTQVSDTTKPLKLSKPAIAAAREGMTQVAVTRNSADASQSGLNIHVKWFSSGNSSPRWEGDCTPDPKTGDCSVVPNPPTLMHGDVIEAAEQIALNGVATTGPATDLIVAAPQGLGAPSISASEGSPFVAVTADKADVGKRGLTIQVSVPGQSTEIGSCQPDSTSGKCSVRLAAALQSSWKIQAIETAGAASGLPTLSDITPVAAFGSPTLTAPHVGDTEIKVSLNSSDATAIKSPLSVNIAIQVDNQQAVNCAPTGPSNQCVRELSGPLVEGNIIKAWEFLAGLPSEAPRAGDGVATATVTNDTLGVPTISRVRESEKSATFKINETDFRKWPGALSIAADIYDGDNPVPGQTDTCTPSGNTVDYCTITFSPLIAGQTIHAKEIPAANATTAPSKPGPESIKDVVQQGYDWGRVRAYFSLGTVFSRTATATDSSTGMTTVKSDFSSPDAFAGFDMELNLYTTQGCLAAAYVTHPTTLASLADAADQCDWRAGHQSAAPSDSYLSNPNRSATHLTAILGSIQDPGIAAMLHLLIRFYSTKNPPSFSQTEVISRLDPLIAALPSQNCAVDDKKCADMLKTAIARLSALELTPVEARQILSSKNGFEARRHRGTLVNAYFNAKLTQTAASNGFVLGTSSNSFHVEGGLHAPLYFSWSRWMYQRRPYALFFAPIGKIGFDTLRNSGTDPLLANSDSMNFHTASTALSKDIYRMMAFGGRIGFLALTPAPNKAPELISYLDVTYGRFDNYFAPTYKGDPSCHATATVEDPNPACVRYPWRLNTTGLFKIPQTPMYIGVDLNKGVGPDNLTIFIGIRTDLSNLLSKLVNVPSQ